VVGEKRRSKGQKVKSWRAGRKRGGKDGSGESGRSEVK
jgi:hypothetical protein